MLGRSRFPMLVPGSTGTTSRGSPSSRVSLWRRPSLAALATAALAVFSGCTVPDSELDLIDLFPFTERGQEVQLIDLGTAAAEPHLIDGWSRSDVLPSGESIAWLVSRATVRFAIREPKDARVIVRCGLVGADSPRTVPITASFNQHRIGSFPVRHGLQERGLRLSARAQRTGTNELVSRARSSRMRRSAPGTPLRRSPAT
jgi:hypothetical protein